MQERGRVFTLPLFEFKESDYSCSLNSYVPYMFTKRLYESENILYRSLERNAEKIEETYLKRTG